MSYHEAWYVQMAWCHQMSYCQDKQTRKKSIWELFWKQEELGWMKDDPAVHSKFLVRQTKNDLEAAMEVFRRGTHRQGWRRAEWLHRCIAWNECSEVGGLLCLQDRVSDGSYLEIYSVTNGKPVQFRQNRRDMIKVRLLGHNACKGILNKL